jgi:prephenate dehydratase
MPSDDDNPSQHVVYLGPAASFSHQAALAVFPTANLHPLPTFSALLTALQSSTSETPPEYAIVPIENSTNGSVNPVLDLLARSGSDNPDIRVCAEYYLPVHHYLYVSQIHAEEAAEKNDPTWLQKRISTIYTHPQVWGQCSKYLATHFTGAEKVDVSSTSQAAALVKQDGTGHTAAICSILAGELNTLHCVGEKIEDDPDKNTTRFFILRNRTRRMGTPGDGPTGKVNVKSLLLFTIKHTQPGALSAALRVFADFKFNLTRIDSRPSGAEPWHYVFFVECEEMRMMSEDYEGNLEAMIQALGKVVESVTELGSWRDALAKPEA